jgi:hypothetical protein
MIADSAQMAVVTVYVLTQLQAATPPGAINTKFGINLMSRDRTGVAPRCKWQIVDDCRIPQRELRPTQLNSTLPNRAQKAAENNERGSGRDTNATQKANDCADVPLFGVLIKWPLARLGRSRRRVRECRAQHGSRGEISEWGGVGLGRHFVHPSEARRTPNPQVAGVWQLSSRSCLAEQPRISG